MRAHKKLRKGFRIAALLALCVLMMVAMTGCSRGTCYECRQEASLNKYVMRGTMGNADQKGETVYLCEDCLRLYKLFGY